jgi:hypothetical protein
MKVEGIVSLFDVGPDGVWKFLTEDKNQIQWTWGEIACHLFGDGNAKYKLNAMYLEFENTASPGDPVTAPSYDADEGVEYYEGLSASPDRDFLRVPLLAAPQKGVVAGYEGKVSFNQLTFLAQSSGTAGVHGKTFSDGANSTVFGLALVAAPVWGDRTQDLVFGRRYYATAKQVPKRASSQIGVSWIERFVQAG